MRFGKGGGTVLGVEIYRGDTPGFSPSTATRIDIVPGNVNSYWDTTLYFEGDASVEEVDDPQETPFLEREVEANRARLKRLRKQVSRMKSRQVVVSEYEAEFIHTPLQLGVQQYYIIRRITARRPAVSIISAVGGTTGGGGTQQIAWGIVLSSYSAPIGPATAFRKMTDADLLLPPNIGQVGSDTVNLADVTFRWLSVRGADEYALFVSTDRNNLVPGKAYMKTVTFTQDRDGVPIEVRLVNELNRYFNVYQPTTFYWRVGYRNTRDMALPYPDGWVWSVVHSFKTAPSPPTPPRERTRK
ncbi:MAG TPA: hypothetical protein EYP10_14020 [Armatimonadetes bacterium]|nr:hypothetical protein [Armatimonadota bacterium]